MIEATRSLRAGWNAVPMVGRIVTISVIIIALVLLAITLARKPLIHVSASMILAERGLKPLDFTVEEAGFDRLVISDLRLGTANSADRIEVNSALGAFFGTGVESVVIEGLQISPSDPVFSNLVRQNSNNVTEQDEQETQSTLHSVLSTLPITQSLDLRSARIILGEPDQLSDAERADFIDFTAGLSFVRDDGPVRPQISFDVLIDHQAIRGRATGKIAIPFGNRIELESRVLNGDLANPTLSIGDIHGQVGATIDLPPGVFSSGAERGGASTDAPNIDFVNASLALRDVNLLGLPSETGSLLVGGGQEELSGFLQLQSDAVNGATEVTATLTNPTRDATLRIDAEARAEGAALVRRFTATAQPITGRLTSLASLDAKLPPLQSWISETWDLGSLAALQPVGFLDVGVENLTMPGRFKSLELSGSVDVRVEDDRLAVTAASPITMNTESIEPVLLRSLGFDYADADFLSAALPTPLSVVVDGAAEDEPLAVELSEEAGGTIAGQIGARMRGVESDLQLAVAGSGSLGTATIPRRYTVSRLELTSTGLSLPFPFLDDIGFSVTGSASGDGATHNARLSLSGQSNLLQINGLEIVNPSLAGDLAISSNDGITRIDAADLIVIDADSLSQSGLETGTAHLVLPLSLALYTDTSGLGAHAVATPPIAVTLRAPGTLDFDGIVTSDGASFQGPLSFLISPVAQSRPLLGVFETGFNVQSQLPIRVSHPNLGPEDVLVTGLRGEVRSQGQNSSSESVELAALQPQRIMAKATIDALRMPSIAATLRSIEFDATVDGDLMTLESAAFSISEVTVSDAVPAMSVSLRGDAKKDTLDLAGDISTTDGSVTIDLIGSSSRDFSRGTVSAELRPIEFTPDGVQPASIAPLFGNYLEAVEGRVRAKSDITLDDTGLTANARLAVEELSASVGGIELQNISSAVVFDDLFALSTPPGQIASAAAISAGVPLRNVLVRFQITPPVDSKTAEPATDAPIGPTFRLQSLDLNLASGSVTAQPVAFDLADPKGEVILQVTEASVEELLDTAQLEGIKGTGTLSGTIPIFVDGQIIRVENGRITSDGPGDLRYAPDTPPPGLQAGPEGAGLVLEALADFKYKTISIDLNGDLAGTAPTQALLSSTNQTEDGTPVVLTPDAGKASPETQVSMRIEGANPSFYDGYPVVFNLNVSGDLGNIVAQSLRGYRTPEVVRKRLLEIMQ
ncbi:MAG: YdbH domain-containing protein [Pseudomonadota bacterium]